MKEVRSIHTRPIDPDSLEIRAADGRAPIISGYAAVFDSPTQIASGYSAYNEVISPGAFRKTIKEADVRALYNHNEMYVLGRSKSQTLTLSEDSKGLKFEVTAPDTTWARDLVESMRRGDVSQSSFAFQPIRQSWTKASSSSELDTRTLQEVRLYDVSVVTYPAYEDTVAQVRSASTAAIAALGRLSRGQPLDDDDIHALREMRAMIDDRLIRHAVEEAPANSHPSIEPAPDHSIDLWRRKMDLVLASL